jgi:hypothetical protein
MGGILKGTPAQIPMATSLCCGKAVINPSVYVHVTKDETVMIHRSQVREFIAAGYSVAGALPFSTVPECLWNHEVTCGSSSEEGSGGGGPAPAPAGSLDGISLTTGGSGYLDGNYTGVPLTGGGGGSGASADITVSGGAVTAATIFATGAGYSAGNTLSADDADLGGNGGSGLAINVDTVADGSGGTMSALFRGYGW